MPISGVGAAVLVLGVGAWFLVGSLLQRDEIKKQVPSVVSVPNSAATSSVVATSTLFVEASTTAAAFFTTNTPQYVVFSFDGSRSLSMWEDTRRFAHEMIAAGKPLHFTYFVSGVYFLSAEFRAAYQAPHEPAGKSLIGFAESKKDVDRRIAEINAAVDEGHEIGSHLNGHFNGVLWSREDWTKEFSVFNNLLFDIQKNNHSSEEQGIKNALHLTPTDVVGFRAPELGKNAGLWEVLHDFHFQYDASGVGKPDVWPTKDANGVWRFSLSSIKVPDAKYHTLSMDYNFYLAQSGGRDLAKKGTPEWRKMYDEMHGAYRAYFNQNYVGSRAPVIIGHHFSLWNDGVYWEVMKDFAREVCGKPEVRCGSFKELVAYLENTTQSNGK